MHVLHLETQVALTNEALSCLVDMLNHGRFDHDAELLGLGELVVEDFDTFADRFVVSYVLDTIDEIPDFQFFLKSVMKNLGLIKELHINVGLCSSDLGEDFVEGCEVVGLHGGAEILLSLKDSVVAVITAAHRSLLDLGVFVLEHPRLARANPAEESITVLAIELDVPEIEP